LISDTTIASIAANVRLSEVAGDYFPVKKRGGRFVALCPFHRERTPSFFINDDGGSYKCFGCGAGGSVFRFIMEMDKISFPEAVRKLGAKAGVAIEEQESEADKLRRGLLSVVYKANQQFFSLLLSKEGVEARKILKERGFNREICEQWGIGFAPKGYALSGHADDHTLSGLTYDNGTLRFTNRIMFGIRDESGTLVGFSGRTTDNHPAKYLNSPESSIFYKGKLLYGLDKAKRSIIDSGQAVIVEGQIDTIRCHLSGITNAVAPLGTGFTASHGSTIRRLCGEAVLVFDGDKAGKEAASKAFAGLASLGVKVRAVMLTDGDPDSFIVSGGDLASLISEAKLYPEALAESLDKDSIENKQIAMGKVGQALSVLEDGIERDELANRCAKLLGIKPSQLKKKMAMGGGHIALPTETRYGEQKGESWKQLIAHLLLCGKESALAYNWNLLADGDIQTIMDSDYEAGNPSSIAKIISQLDNNAEAAIQGISHQDIADLDIHSIYKSMLEAEIKRRTSMVDLMPLLDTLKKL
jgi:DNA primase